MTENEFMREMIKAAGGDPDKLPDRLKSTYYQCLIDCMNKGGGSGGGVSSWNDLTDKPFKEKRVEVLPETEVVFATLEELGEIKMAELSYGFTSSPGERFIVKYNEEEYICERSMLTNGFGNAVVEGGEDTGEPFFLASEDTYTVIVSIRGDNIAKIAIYRIDIETLDYVFLPEPPLFDLTQYQRNGDIVSPFTVDGNVTLKLTIDNVDELIKLKMMGKYGIVRFKILQHPNNSASTPIQTSIFYANTCYISPNDGEPNCTFFAHPHFLKTGLDINVDTTMIALTQVSY